MNSLTRLYTTYPIDRPVLTIIIVLMISAFLALGASGFSLMMILLKCFRNRSPQAIWDEIQNEFGSTEYLIAAIEHDNILNDSKFYNRISSFSNKLYQATDNNGNQLVNRVLSITELDIFSDQKEKFSDTTK